MTMAFSDKVKYQGRTVNRGTRDMMIAANKMLASDHFGGEKGDLTLVQGSYSGGVSASAGTHNGGAAIDITPFNWKNREKVFRLLGMAMWNRPTLRGVWSQHLHGIVCGDGSASRGAKQQVSAYYKRRNGLANNGPDAGYKMLVFPLFVSTEKAAGKPGVRYLTKNFESREQPTTKAKSRGVVKKGAKFTVVAVVNANGTYWAVNPDGRFVPSSALTTKAPAKAKPVAKPKPAPVPKPKPVAKSTIAAVTFNIPDRTKLKNASEEDRVKAGIDRIKDYAPDIIGFNELVGPGKDSTTNEPSAFANKVKAALGSGYGFVVPTTAYNENYLAYNKGTTSLVKQYGDSKVYVKVGNVAVPGRHVTRVVLKDESGLVYAVGITHLVEDKSGTDAARQAQAEHVMKTMKAVSAKHGNCPIIVMGDMNINDDLKAFVVGGLVNTRKVAETKINASVSTYTNISKDKYATDADWIIDQIYVPKDWSVKTYAVLLDIDKVTKKFNKPRASDHHPLLAVAHK